MFIFMFWLAIAFWTWGVASGRGRASFGWFLLALLFGPLALIVVCLLPSRMATCYMCRAPIDAEARKCPHCQTMLSSDGQRAVRR